MWETLFDVNLLDGQNEAAIWCPTEESAETLLRLLEDIGYRWRFGSLLPHEDLEWEKYGEDTIYFADQYFRLAYGSKQLTETQWRGHCFCRFDNDLYNMSPIGVEDLL